MTGFDLFERLAQSETGRHLLDDLNDSWAKRDGTARQAQWLAEDGWLIVYTTTRVEGGPHDGRFVTQALKPIGRGSRSGRKGAERWVEVYRRAFTTRRKAKARAEALYRQHSPTYRADMEARGV